VPKAKQAAAAAVMSSAGQWLVAFTTKSKQKQKQKKKAKHRFPE
jgi:hypothetical protein